MNTLVDDTHVVWGGEFGRIPMAQERRNQHIKVFDLDGELVELKVVFPTETDDLVILQRKMWSMSVIFMQRCSIN